MNTGQRTILLLFALLALATCRAGAMMEVSGGFSFVTPMGEFNRVVNSLWGHEGGQRGLGAELKVGWGFGDESTVLVGVFGDAMYLDFGDGFRSDPFGLIVLGSDHLPTYGDKSTHFELLMLSSGLSLSTRKGSLRPYAEIYGGITSYTTSTSVNRVFVTGRPSSGGQNIFYLDNKPLISENQVWHIGVNTGLKVCMWPNNLEKGANGLLKEILININFGYLMGGDIEYFDQNSIQPENGLFMPEKTPSISHELIAAKTNMFKLHIALEFDF